MTEATGLPTWEVMLLAALGGYLIGSIPWGYLITRWAGAGDIRSIGSGNIGATNVLRTGRKGLAAATLAADILKGAIPVWVALALGGVTAGAVAGAGAILGHCFPVWLGFKGGKGVATSGGVMLALTPVLVPMLLVALVLVVWATRFVSLGSITAAVLAPVLALLLGYQDAVWLYLLIAVVVVAKHHENIARLIQGRENRFSLGGAGRS
ncbi:MAG: glycerol-3-phosphate 1-O-acyltransferase PlsY [Geminicoccaceae bacterium]